MSMESTVGIAVNVDAGFDLSSAGTSVCENAHAAEAQWPVG